MVSLSFNHLEGRQIIATVDPQAEQRAVDLAGCYVIVTDVAKVQLAAQAVHDPYLALQKIERDFRTMKTGMLEVRPVFVRKDGQTRGMHVFLGRKIRLSWTQRVIAMVESEILTPVA